MCEVAPLEQVALGIIGGTGVYNIDGLTDVKTYDLDTPFGKPSEPIQVGTLGGMRCAFLARHSKDHSILPSEINFRANIFAMKLLGVKYLLSISACGSLKEEYAPTDMVVVDDFIDRTKNREATFFGDGLVGHVMFGTPTCEDFSQLVHTAVTKALPHIKVHKGGTYLCMEGPAFSTRAESRMYQQMGAHVIGMTALTEAKLAREAEMAFALCSCVTDYDAWRVGEEPVTVEAVMKVLRQNADNTQLLVTEVVNSLSKNMLESGAHTACMYSICTKPHAIPEATKTALAPLFGKYFTCAS
jgi:5'-methylthioadenosine phosphorylase